MNKDKTYVMYAGVPLITWRRENTWDTCSAMKISINSENEGVLQKCEVTLI